MKTIALVAHDAKKNDLLEFVKDNKKHLIKYHLIGTTNTSKLIGNVLDIQIEPFGHGPNGGDILLAAQILRGEVDEIIFFIDPQTPHGHEHDIQTLIRTAVINDVPIALNRATARLMLQTEI